jgi:manganese/zinc/iron transport system substrate-binding protein
MVNRPTLGFRLGRRSALSVLAVTIACGSLLLAACGRNAPPAPTATGGLRVVATTPMLGDLVRRIAPEASSEHLIGEGVDPHLYKPTRTDIVALSEADVIVANGLLLEGRMSDAFDRAEEAGRLVVRVAERLPVELLRQEAADAGASEGHGATDPHIWMDPTLWAKAGMRLADALAERDPANALAYRSNGANFTAAATELARRAHQAIATVPADRRVLVTAHDAFGYLGAQFALEVHAIQGISTESEAGLADLEGLVDFLVERRVPAVFVESTVSPRTIEALIAGAKARGHEVRIGGELFSDSMGAPGSFEGTWPGMFAHNIATIVNALGGSADAKSLVPEALLTADRP